MPIAQRSQCRLMQGHLLGCESLIRLSAVIPNPFRSVAFVGVPLGTSAAVLTGAYPSLSCACKRSEVNFKFDNPEHTTAHNLGCISKKIKKNTSYDRSGSRGLRTNSTNARREDRRMFPLHPSRPKATRGLLTCWLKSYYKGEVIKTHYTSAPRSPKQTKKKHAD